MIEKIVSDDISAAGQAAMEFARSHGLPHGTGLDPSGSIKEASRDAGPLGRRYGSLEKNVQASDGTLVLTSGALKGGARIACDCSERHCRPCLHIDLAQIAAFAASSHIVDWISANRIRVLNITGSPEDQRTGIHRKTLDILEAIFHLLRIQTGFPLLLPAKSSSAGGRPITVASAAELVISKLSLKKRLQIARLEETDLKPLYFSLGEYLVDELKLFEGNEELIHSCMAYAGAHLLDLEDAPAVVIHEIWRRLRETHRLRVIK